MKQFHNILFICGHYADPNHANSICVQNLAEEFVQEGHRVWVIARGASKNTPVNEKKNDVHISRIKEKWSVQFDNWIATKKWGGPIYRMVHLLRYFYTFFLYPNVSPLTSRRMQVLATRIINESNIDTIIATYRPYESIEAALKIKEKLKDKVTLITYHLDLINSPNNKSSYIVNIKKKKNVKAIKRELEIADKILLPNSAPPIDNDKVKFVDFPMFVKRENEDNDKRADFFDSQCINVAYIGSLDSKNRNPSKALQLFQSIGEVSNKKVLLHIWGKLSDGETNSLLLGSVGDTIKYHGMIAPEIVPSVLKHADYLLNICNNITYKMVPSKIFQYFASERPIVCLVGNKDDLSLPYFRKYGNCLELTNEMSIEEMAEKIHKFIESQKTILMPVDQFRECTPEFICGVCLN